MRIFTRSLCFVLACSSAVAFGEALSISKVEPPSWWVGMQHNEVELMIYGEQLSEAKFASADSRIEILASSAVGNSDYHFLTIRIPNDLPAGTYAFEARHGNDLATFEFRH